MEKPLARNVREALNIVETVARAGSLFMVGHTLRFNSVVRALESAALPDASHLSEALALIETLTPSIETSPAAFSAMPPGLSTDTPTHTLSGHGSREATRATRSARFVRT